MLQVGDLIEENGKPTTVLSVSNEVAIGLFNPHTLSGDIMVNGVKTSSYTAAVAPGLAHAALWPVRMMYGLGYDIINGAFDQGSELIASLTPRGKDKY